MQQLFNFFERRVRGAVASRLRSAMESMNSRARRSLLGVGPFHLVAGAACAAALMAVPAWAKEEPVDAQQDFSGLTWSKSFDATIDVLKVRYPFTAHKGIDWERARTTFRPAMVEADSTSAPLAGYQAWREFVHQTLHDGHVFFGPTDSSSSEVANAVEAQHLGANFGLEIARCDDGSVLVVRAAAAAAAQGLTFGAQLLEWNGQPVAQALAATNLVWTQIIASAEAIPVLQEQLLVRAPVGASVAVRFIPAGGTPAGAREATLVARTEEEWSSPSFASSAYGRIAPRSDGWPAFGAELRPDGIGVLTLYQVQPPGPSGVDPSTFTEEMIAAVVHAMALSVKQSLDGLRREGARGIVVDLRNNPGGLDGLGAMIAGCFDDRARHYLTVVGFDSTTRRWQAQYRPGVMSSPIYVEPVEAPYGGRIVVLVNPDTVSAGEGLAYRLGQLPNATVVGLFGSNGSFGNTGGMVLVGGGFGLLFPIERCVDERGRIMLDADAAGRGGVIPQVRVPRTPATLHALFAEGRDVEMETAAALLLAAPSDTAIPAVAPAQVKAASGASVVLRAPEGAAGYQWFEGERGDTSRPVAGGITASLGVRVGHNTSYWVRLYREVGAVDSAAVPILSPVPVEVSTIITHPANQSVVRGTSASLAVAATGTAPLTYQWFRNGRPLQGATRPSLDFFYFDVVNAGIYDVLVTGSEGALSRPVVIGVALPQGLRCAGTVTTREEWQDVRHPNGAVYDQFLLTGAAGTFTADPGQAARMSYLDDNGSIVQVELSGAGSITVALDNPAGPVDPLLYDQPGIRYMKGKATIILAGADSSTHFTIYSVGKANNPGVVRPDVSYPGWADVAAAGIVSTNGMLGGIHQGNVAYSSSIGLTGIYAPTVTSVSLSAVVHSIAASGSARPYLYFGDESDVCVKIAGSALVQPNGDSIAVGGLDWVYMGDGEDSCGRAAPAQVIQAAIVDDSGTDRTPVIVIGPGVGSIVPSVDDSDSERPPVSVVGP